MSDDSLVINLPELAKKLSISRGLCYSLAKQNKLPCPVLHLGRRLVVSRKAVEDLLQAKKTDKAE